MQRAVTGEADKQAAAIFGGGQAGAFALHRRMAALAVVGVERVAGDLERDDVRPLGGLEAERRGDALAGRAAIAGGDVAAVGELTAA